MADQETWAKRVAEWKASGLSSPAFCQGKDFTPGGLRYMAHRLGVGRSPRPQRPRIAKVVRVEAARPAEPSPVPVVVELGAARIEVRRGIDRATLAAVVEVLTASAGSAR
jgi:transposase